MPCFSKFGCFLLLGLLRCRSWSVAHEQNGAAAVGLARRLRAGGRAASLVGCRSCEAVRLFLERMIRHHQGAIKMAQAEIASGKNPDAITLAKNTAEIAEQDLNLPGD
jgi:uncharacterized protein (DUF305 family)